MAHPGGRPTKYTQELADLICEKIATSTLGTKRLCVTNKDLPDDTTIYAWRYKYPEFSRKYAEAKCKQAELMAEEIIDISDDSRGDIKVDEFGNETVNSEFVARSRLRVDSRKWYASKLAPKIFGDKQQIETVTSENLELKEELAELRAKLAEQSKREY